VTSVLVGEIGSSACRITASSWVESETSLTSTLTVS
jgi:hypothetical protein